MHDVLDIIKNVESIYDSNTSFNVLKDFERVLDELDIYVYKNWSDGEIAEKISEIFDMRPYFIEKRLKLRTPIYSETAAYGHMGRTPEIKIVTFSNPMGETVSQEVETFTWEKLDYVDKIKEVFLL